MLPRIIGSLKFWIIFIILFVISVFIAIIIQTIIDGSLATLEDNNRILFLGFSMNQERLQHIEKVCTKYNLGMYRNYSSKPAFLEPPVPQYEVFYIDLEHKLSWCPIYKAGSTTWLHNFAILGGTSEKALGRITKQLSEVVRERFPVMRGPAAKKSLHRTLRFMVVRHPFERILSAYRDKLENAAVRKEDGTHFYYEKFGRKIVEKYRPGGNKTNVRLLLKPKQYMWTENKQPIGVEPSFKEFVNYLIDLDFLVEADDHWVPYYLFCTPCLIKYNVIGKLETMQDDQRFTIFKANLTKKLTPKWLHRNSPSVTRTENQVSEVAKMYFSQLTRTEIKKLYKKYQLDFELFEYEPRNYYDYATRRRRPMFRRFFKDV